MSKRSREKKAKGEAPVEQDPLVRKVRLAALGLLIALQWCCIAGSQGSWWQPLYRGQPFGDPTVGVGNAWGLIIAVAALAGFFFTSYDLVAREDLYLPILLASLAVAGAAGVVFHRVWISESTIESIARDVGVAQMSGRLPPPDVAPVGSTEAARTVVDPTLTPGAEPARVEEQDVLTSGGLSLRFRWGLALILSAAPLMVVVSGALTFLARRAQEPAT